VWWAENEPVSDGGNPPRPIRLFRMAEHSTQDLFASRVPVHSALVQKSVTTNTNLAGRLSPRMLGNREQIRKRKMQNSWQKVCYRHVPHASPEMNRGLRSIFPRQGKLAFCIRLSLSDAVNFRNKNEKQLWRWAFQPARRVSCNTSSSALASLLARCRASGEGVSSRRCSR
jgi:hypothetical protein